MITSYCADTFLLIHLTVAKLLVAVFIFRLHSMFSRLCAPRHLTCRWFYRCCLITTAVIVMCSWAVFCVCVCVCVGISSAMGDIWGWGGPSRSCMFCNLPRPSSFFPLGRSSWPACVTLTAVRIYATWLPADGLHTWKSAHEIQPCSSVFSTKNRRRLVRFFFYISVCRDSKLIDQINIFLNYSGCCQIRVA